MGGILLFQFSSCVYPFVFCVRSPRSHTAMWFFGVLLAVTFHFTISSRFDHLDTLQCLPSLGYELRRIVLVEPSLSFFSLL